jgi:arylsulfatase A-like enzyme
MFRRRIPPRPTATLLGCLALCAACGDEPPPRGPAPERILVEPDFGLLKKRDPERDVPVWLRRGSFVQSDERDAHVLQPSIDEGMPLPAGARACETAVAVSMSASDAAGRTLAVSLEVEEKGRRRRVLEKTVELSVAREGWLTLEADFGGELRAGSRLVARAVPDTTQPWPADARIFLAQPIRSGGGDDRPNLLIISIDTLRADHLGCYGYARDTSPRIDGLARRGVLFEQACSTAPWTLPSYGSLFTSRSPTVHRAGMNAQRAAAFEKPGDASASHDVEALAPDLPVLAQILRDKGWATAGFHYNPYLWGKSGIQRGFERWIMYRYCADTGVDLALDWIRRRRGAPWFAFVHAFDPHKPYTPPSPYDRKYADRAPENVPGYPPALEITRAQDVEPAMRRFMADQYDGEIAWTDQQIGRLLDGLAQSGELARTLIVFHSDHGEELWDHGGYEHGHALYEELLHVPLVVAFEGRIPAGKRVKQRVSLLDVMPTVLGILDIDAPGELEGIDLAPAWEGSKLPARELLSECLLYGAREAKAIYVGNEKLILRAGEPPLLYDLAADPLEKNDLAATRAARAQELQAKLVRRAQTLTARAHASAVREFSERERAELQRVGYGGGADVGPGKNPGKQ